MWPVQPDLPVGLSLLPEELAQTMLGCNVVQLRRGATRAARLAMAKVGLVDPRVDVALAALDSWRTGEGPARDAIGRLVGELDAAAAAARERDEAAEFERAFRQARSANALWSALDADPTVAAADAAYEAYAALGDWEPLTALWG